MKPVEIIFRGVFIKMSPVIILKKHLMTHGQKLFADLPDKIMSERYRHIEAFRITLYFCQAGYQNSNLSFVKQDIRIIVFFLSNINLRMTIILSSSKGFRMTNFLRLKIQYLYLFFCVARKTTVTANAMNSAATIETQIPSSSQISGNIITAAT